MKIRLIKAVAFTLLTGVFFSCEDLTKVNINPNGVQPEVVNPNLVMPTVLTEMSKAYVNLGYQDIAGVVQHTQKDAWSSGHNDYDWGGNQSWSGYYDILRNNDLLYSRSVALNWEFQQGVALVNKAFMFGLITDLWGDAPYTNALKGETGGTDNILPAYDSQEVIYTGILADLEKANTLLSKQKSEYSNIVDNVDVIYSGDPTKWRKLANSLALRYYMRISAKKPDVAKAGIEKIAKNPANYPVILANSDDATMGFPGTSDGTSWPANAVYDVSGSNYRRIKMANTLVDYLQGVKDPRLGIWAAKVEIPLVVDATLPAKTDKIIDGKRYLSPDVVGNTKVDTDQEYVGLPTAFSQLPSAYNMNPTPGQTSFNPHVSFLAPMYKNASGALLRARLVSAAEVNFILAEAALKGYAVGDAKTFYENGVKASLTTWGVGSTSTTYLANPGVAFAGTVKQVMEQKWIASWTAATEAWFDFRRTGFPELKAGPVAKRQAIPVRFYYMQDELRINSKNTAAALDKLEVTNFSQADGKNSAWSKPWVIQGTGKPY
ncbi:SusD/RagB family nutrient-binding outer membrane lipoprotein [Aquirufa ecclesiirivi]|uniref:SusD/RagB family nutrient-binding outer membrane lipoprotein n=1 Tax=Aquirufa ecclesiirivi TaxID=2715124 RepID=A0ABT4JFY1_9BACT|nr:SusD/RagB family nutrient-binding outer membrane lipoprotein [Aquirufa ecclesiirivi]MCZ2473033.1 SusD/RagB family nutrient-binding outer membrane lipoprotein [Aquirufa ecclesiirivi]MCZ2474818.1 SusD/RagB family nutrient-binding outer membrane lipoprotein [Aquirufa ecclesiirivi]MDF0692798.1 SusD/RagB family nutrient-binding outer membrane lipoprotein [Aquirufa ecclesiirivi]NHC47849.1 SusD/RagB family nutrient-binding outer membrane lipoprotein [Aquirufa ecclesiirivi]